MVRTRFSKELKGTQREGTSPWFALACEVFLGSTFFSVYVRQMPFAIVRGEAAFQKEERLKYYEMAITYLKEDYANGGAQAVITQNFRKIVS